MVSLDQHPTVLYHGAHFEFTGGEKPVAATVVCLLAFGRCFPS